MYQQLQNKNTTVMKEQIMELNCNINSSQL